MPVTKRVCQIYHDITNSTVTDNNRRTQENSKDKPSMKRYLQEPPGVAERILNSDASLERNHVQFGEIVGGLPEDDELMKELASLTNGGSPTRSPP
jgi:hypothetical protein